MGISDLIAGFLQESLEEAEHGVLEIRRAELAQRFHCVPSQINYVMATRFSPERGYIVESRRGGNGYIRITRVQTEGPDRILEAIASVGGQLELPAAQALLEGLCASGGLDPAVSRVILAAVDERTLAALPAPLRSTVRASIFKQTLIRAADLSET